MILVPLFSGCTFDSLHKKRLTGQFTNGNFQFFKNKYPLLLDVKGTLNQLERNKAIDITIDHLKDHPRLSSANLVSTATYDGPDKGEISFIVNVNSNPLKSGKNICSKDIPELSALIPNELIKTANIGFCRNDKTLSYISAKLKKPVSMKSSEFKKILRRAASSILYRKSPTERCQINCNF